MSQQISPLLHHVTLNTGHVATHELQGAHTLSAIEFLPLLDEGRGEVPGMPGFDFVLSEGDHCCQFVLGCRGCELVTAGLGWRLVDGDSLWRWLGDYYDNLAPWFPGRRAFFSTYTPPGLPWLGVVRALSLGLIAPEQARKLSAVERDLALALIQRSMTRN